MKNFSYDTTTQRSFEQSVQDLVKSIENNNFKVLHVHDVQATLASKDIHHNAYKIIEFCRAPAAKKVLDINPKIGLFLPCKAIVFSQEEKVSISILSPQILAHFFHDSCINDSAKNIDTDIQKILTEFHNYEK